MDLTRLRAAVARDKTVNESAKTLITLYAQRLRDAAGDEAAVNALADEMEGNQDDLAAAVEEGTVDGPTTEAPPA